MVDGRARWSRKPKIWKDGAGRIILICLVGRWSSYPSYGAISPAPPRRRIIGDPCGGIHPGMARVYCLLVYNGSGTTMVERICDRGELEIIILRNIFFW